MSKVIRARRTGAPALTVCLICTPGPTREGAGLCAAHIGALTTRFTEARKIRETPEVTESAFGEVER